MAATPTPTVSASPVPSATPVALQTMTATPAPTPSVDPSLVTQLTHIDPLVWAAIFGTMVIPFLHTQLKKVATFLNDKRHRTTNYFIAGALNLIVGYGFDLQNSGVLARLHDPALGGLLATGLSFLLGQQVYGFFVKTNEDLNKTTAAPAPGAPGSTVYPDGLPRTTNP